MGISQAWAQQNYIGVAGVAMPRYEGSDEYRLRPVPLINYETRHFFVSPRAGLPALGLKFSPLTDVSAGVFLGMDMGRDENDDDHLEGMGDIDFHALYGVYAAWSPGRYEFSAAWRQAARSGYGGMLELGASYQLLRAQRDVVTVGLSTTWANSASMQTWFGVSPTQSARSDGRLESYDAGSGFQSARLSANWAHRLDDGWSVITTAGVRTLLGDARDSPIVERRTSVYGGVGFTYAF